MVKNHPIKGSLGSYQIIETLDGSTTLFSEAYQEACHSDQGAYEETLFNYIQGNDVPKRYSLLDTHEFLTIFEVGFATGLGVVVTLDALKNCETKGMGLKFISTEIDRDLCLFSLGKLKDDGVISSFEEVNESGLELYKCPFKPITGELMVLTGDARKTLPLWRESSYALKVDCVYQDAFSPKRNPELWTTEWFHDLARVSHEWTTMTTYSATKAVWKSMIEAGWKVSAVKGFKNKKLSTRAFRTGESAADVLEWCKRSPTPALSDRSLL